MNRRDFLVQSSQMAAATALSSQQMFGETSGSPGHSREVRLQDEDLLIVFDAGSGALIHLERKATGWILQRRPELGVSFRMLAPLPHRRDNFVLGQRQQAAEVKKLSEHKVRLQWRNLVSEHGGVLPMTFTAVVTLGHGTLTFDSTLVNDSSLMVETIDYPYLGDLSAPTHDTPMRSEHMWYGNLVGDELSPEFANEKGYWGVRFPTKTIESKQSLFCLIQAPREGLYVEMHDPTQPYLLEDTFELHPGVLQSVNDTVPHADAISGMPVHLEFRTSHFVFAHPKSIRKLVPVVLRCYSGDWHAGVDLYKEWRATWFQKPHVAAWVAEVHSWQQLQVNTPEQDYSIPYRNLTKYIDECANNGVGAIQLVGWNIEGQDGGDPNLDTDPGLGTWQQLYDVIAYAKQKGVKMVLFGKLNWADMTTEWFRKELYKYAATDPYGIPYQQGGYSYITPTQLAGINNHRREVMDFLCPSYRDIATRQFEKILALGAAGWLFDEVCHHGPVEYSFSPDHGYAPPGYIYAGDLPMSRQLRAAADKVDPEFIFAGEGPQDWLMQYYPVSYFRINGSCRAVCRYIDSAAPLMVAVTGFDDREKLNLILMNRYIISYEPYNFKGHVTDFPLTLAYGKRIDALRRKYRSYLWDAEFRDTLGATVSSDGTHRYSVFVRPDSKRAVVVVNEKSDAAITATIHLPNPGKLAVVTPEQTELRPTSGTLQILARSAAVVLEL